MFCKPCSLKTLSQVTEIICVFGFSAKLVKLVEKLAKLAGLQGCKFCRTPRLAKLRYTRSKDLAELTCKYSLGNSYEPCKFRSFSTLVPL